MIAKSKRWTRAGYRRRSFRPQEKFTLSLFRSELNWSSCSGQTAVIGTMMKPCAPPSMVAGKALIGPGTFIPSMDLSYSTLTTILSSPVVFLLRICEPQHEVGDIDSSLCGCRQSSSLPKQRLPVHHRPNCYFLTYPIHRLRSRQLHTRSETWSYRFQISEYCRCGFAR